MACEKGFCMSMASKLQREDEVSFDRVFMLLRAIFSILLYPEFSSRRLLFRSAVDYTNMLEEYQILSLCKWEKAYQMNSSIQKKNLPHLN